MEDRAICTYGAFTKSNNAHSFAFKPNSNQVKRSHVKQISNVN